MTGSMTREIAGLEKNAPRQLFVLAGLDPRVILKGTGYNQCLPRSGTGTVQELKLKVYKIIAGRCRSRHFSLRFFLAAAF